MPGGGGIGLPETDVGATPGGGGMSLPVAERGALGAGAVTELGGPAVAMPAAGACGVAGVADAGAPGASAAAGRGAGAAGASAAAGRGAGADVGAAAAGRAGASGSSRRTGRGGCSLPDEVTTRLGAAGLVGAGLAAGSAGASLAAGAAAGSAAAAAGSDAEDFLVAFVALSGLSALAGLSCSGWTSRISPSRSALRRTRSAWASSMLDEWLFAPIPSASQRSSVSLLVSPSSRASS